MLFWQENGLINHDIFMNWKIIEQENYGKKKFAEEFI